MEELLLAEGVLEEMPDGSDLRLTESFEEVWNRRIDRIQYGDRALRWVAAFHEVDPDELEVEEGTDRYAIAHGESTIEEWPSRESFLAGVVVEPTLREWLPEERWDEFSPEERRELAVLVLVFLERCPSCGDSLVFGDESADDEAPDEGAPAATTPAGETDEDEGPINVSLHCPTCDATIVSGSYQ
jgi:hypothetical protein